MVLEVMGCGRIKTLRQTVLDSTPRHRKVEFILSRRETLPGASKVTIGFIVGAPIDLRFKTTRLQNMIPE